MLDTSFVTHSSRVKGLLPLVAEMSDSLAIHAVLIAGLFNAFFLILSLRLLWRRYVLITQQYAEAVQVHCTPLFTGLLSSVTAFQLQHSVLVKVEPFMQRLLPDAVAACCCCSASLSLLADISMAR